MKFSTKRGRPKNQYNANDLGTIELQNKRNNNQTLEPLDAIFQKSLITEVEYQAGCRLRWLYSLKFGIPNISAYNLSYIDGKETKLINLKWLSIKEKEFKAAVDLLISLKAYSTISNICIFLKYPSFLIKNFQNKYMVEQNSNEFYKFKHAILELSGFFNLEKLSRSRTQMDKL